MKLINSKFVDSDKTVEMAWGLLAGLKLHAQTVSESGKLMANKLRMSTMYTMIDGHIKRIENTYMLDMNEPAASKIIGEFQERLKAKDQALN